jgi:rRNA small subunit pseudouridine methyltransferase Nep1
VHQCLLALLDSPLAKSGRLQIFIHTQRDILIEVNPQIRIPRTYKRFAGLMVQLLQKLSVKAADSKHGKLLKVIKNPVAKHLPVGAKRILMNPHASSFVNIHDYVETTPLDSPTVFVIGAMAKGVCKVDYADEEICISNFSLSAASVCSKLCYAYEEYFNII